MELERIYETYVTQVAKRLEDSKAFDGLWGWGDDPKNDPCHMQFYEEVGACVDNLASGCTEEAAFRAADWIIRTPVEYEGTAASWFMLAVHGHCLKLVPLLSPAHCAHLRDYYDAAYPRRDRLPVQVNLYKLLKKGAK